MQRYCIMWLDEVNTERLAGWREKGKDVLTVRVQTGKVFYVGKTYLFWVGDCNIITEINKKTLQCLFLKSFFNWKSKLIMTAANSIRPLFL